MRLSGAHTYYLFRKKESTASRGCHRLISREVGTISDSDILQRHPHGAATSSGIERLLRRADSLSLALRKRVKPEFSASSHDSVSIPDFLLVAYGAIVSVILLLV